MYQYFILVPIILCSLLTGCATVSVYDVNPSYERVGNDYFDILLEPQPAAGQHYFNSFRFVIINKTDKPINLDWQNTNYIYNGSKAGQFGWDKMTFGDLKEVRENPHRTIEGGGTKTAIIFPIKLLARMDLSHRARLGGPGPEGQFELGPLPSGENGMRLTIIQNGKRIQETITFNIEKTELKK